MRAARNTAFQYPGSKARISPWIIEHLPAHNTYVEPFGGSAAVLLNKDPSPNEVYNDLDGDLVHFFTTLRDRGDELHEWLSSTPHSRKLYREFREDYFSDHTPSDDVERAGRYFIVRQGSFNGKVSESQSFRTCTESRGYESDSVAVSFQNSIENLREFADRFQRVTIEHDDYTSVVERYDSPSTVFYFDPPYVDVGEEYYQYGEFDHSRLFETLTGLEGDAVVSYEESPDSVPETWRVVERESTSTLNRGNGEEKTGVERLILSYDLDTTPRFVGGCYEQTKLGGVTDAE